MEQTSNKTKSWNGYVCPGCRTVFRVAADFRGHEVVCPACQEYLQLPEKNEVPPPQDGQPATLLPPSVIVRSHTATQPRDARSSGGWHKITLVTAVPLAVILLAWVFHKWKPRAIAGTNTPAADQMIETIADQEPAIEPLKPPASGTTRDTGTAKPPTRDSTSQESSTGDEDGLVAAVPFSPGAARPQPPFTGRPPAAAGQYRIHRVQRGDTLSRISRKYACDPAEIMRLNGLKNDVILLGADLRIPPPNRP